MDDRTQGTYDDLESRAAKLLDMETERRKRGKKDGKKTQTAPPEVNT